jgi:ABC-2 type transport system ATP-binding protein
MTTRPPSSRFTCGGRRSHNPRIHGEEADLPEPIIVLSEVKKGLGTRAILKGVTFQVERGDIFGYLGPNGAGKTTTIRIMLGLLAPDSGTIRVLGQDIAIDETRRRVGFVLEMDGLYDNMTARENLVYYGRIYGVADAASRVRQLLEQVQLADREKDKVGTYSKGMRQRLALARAMLHDPEVLILDEPTAGVDPSGQIEVRQVILDMAKHGKTILLSSHNLDEVQRICNRIALIHRGEIRLTGELGNLQRSMGRGEVTIETAVPIPDAVLTDLTAQTGAAVHSRTDRTTVFALTRPGSDVADLVTFLAGRGVRIEQAKRQDASLEEIYTTILKEAERS